MKKSLGPNTIVYPHPVFVVGTYDNAGKANVMTVAWGGIACSSPPCIAISIRKATYTYGNIIERRAFTVNIPSEKYIKHADHFGIISGKNEDKCAVTGVTPVRSETVDAPYVKEFPFALECRLLHIHELGFHTQCIGEIIDIKVDEEVLSDGVRPDIEKIKPCLYDHSSFAYYGIGAFLGKAYSIGKEF